MIVRVDQSGHGEQARRRRRARRLDRGDPPVVDGDVDAGRPGFVARSQERDADESHFAPGSASGSSMTLTCAATMRQP